MRHGDTRSYVRSDESARRNRCPNGRTARGPERTPGRIVISEFIPGVPGDNNYEFIELYNAGTEAVDLRGWSLWYRMADNQEEKRVFFWTTRTDVPGYGHYLLVRAGQDVGVVP